ncbi:MAG: hypothetical protein ROR55_10980 [Devosia sp.]
MAYGLSQRCALITLAMKGGEAKNTELTLKKPGRDQLENNHLITVDIRKRPFTLRLTDRGWRAFEEEMVAEPPPRSGIAGPALYATLHALSGLFSRENRSLREALGIGPAKHGERAGGKEPSIRATGSEPAPDAMRDDPQMMVRRAYESLAQKDRDWVELAHLRQTLNHIPREDIDSALMHMLNAKQLELTAHEDQGRLTRTQRDAALKVGRMQMHLVSLRR